MPRLILTCFNALTINLDTQPAIFRSAKDRALLVYLANEQDRSHTREFLAGLLWPDEPESRARRNLSTALLNLRRAIGDRTSDPPFLHTTAQTIAFNPASDYQVDVLTFETHLATTAAHTHPSLHACEPCAQDLAATVDLYRGSFLEGFTIAESDLFAQWLLTRREKLHRQALDAFTALSTYHETQGELAQALTVSQRLLDLVPWQEEAHRQLMRLLALNGRRTQALAQYEACCRALADELGVPPADATNALYDQILAGELTPDAAPLSAAGPLSVAPPPLRVPFQALAPPPHFVARTAETTQLAATLTQTANPILALVGMGGAGKTTLAAQTAHEMRGHYGDGVLWANALTSSPQDILAAWGRAYGYDFDGLADIESRAAAVRGMLADKRALLVVDNVTDAAQVRPLLPSNDSCALLLTTRNLDVAYALNAQTVPLGELTAESAGQLLVQILGADRVQAEAAAAAEICALLHYLPLAVEIAAQRLKSRARMKLAAMAARLRNEQHRLGLEISDQAVRTSFMVSWEALDEELQRIFALLAVFEGRSFAVAAVAYLADIDESAAEDQLYALTALSLLKEEAEEGYFRQHPLLADFAQEQLIQVDEAYERMAAYYLAFTQKHNQNYDVLEPERGNILGSIEASHRLENWTAVSQLADLLAPIWKTRAQYNDARHAFAWTQEAVEKLDDMELQAVNLLRWGEICIEQSEYDEATQLLNKGLAIVFHLEDESNIADAQYHLARIAIERNEFDYASGLLDECESIRLQHGEPLKLSETYVSQARIHLDYRLNYMEAERLGQKALEIQESSNNKALSVQTLQLLAQVATEQGHYVNALHYAERAKELCEEIQNPGELAVILYILAIIYRSQQSYNTAQQFALQSLQSCRHLGLRRIEGMVLNQLSMIYIRTENYGQAIDAAEQSREIFDELQDQLGYTYALRSLGYIHMKIGRGDIAKKQWLEAQGIAQHLGNEPLLKWLQENLQSIHMK